MTQRVYVGPDSSSLTEKANNVRDPQKLYAAVGVDPDGAQRVWELPQAEEAAIRAEWSANAARPPEKPPIGAEQLARVLLDVGVRKGDGTPLTVADLGDVRPPPARGP